MNLSRSIFIIVFLLFVFGCQRHEKMRDLSKIELSRGMNLNQVIDSIGKHPERIWDCDDSFGVKGWKLQVIFWDEKGRLDVYFNKELNLEYYSYDD